MKEIAMTLYDLTIRVTDNGNMTRTITDCSVTTRPNSMALSQMTENDSTSNGESIGNAIRLSPCGDNQLFEGVTAT
jgi:hypothetical protein